MTSIDGKNSLVACILLLLAGSGCASMDSLTASVKSVPGRMKSLVTRTSPVDEDDPLAVATTDVSTGYRTARKELKQADDTMLKFAQWREDLGDLNEAKQRYQDILTTDPNNLDARLGIARVEYRTGRVADAEKILQATARKHPNSSAVWVEMGRIQTEREEYGQAVQSFQKAIEIEPSSTPAQYELGLALARTDRMDEARRYLTTAVGESAALYNIGFVLQQQNRKQEAMMWLQKAHDAHPDERTRAMTNQLIAQLAAEASGKNVQVASLPRQQNIIDVKQTSFESYRETPGQSAPTNIAAAGFSTDGAETRQTPPGPFYEAATSTQQHQTSGWPTNHAAPAPSAGHPQMPGPYSGTNSFDAGAPAMSGQTVMPGAPTGATIWTPNSAGRANYSSSGTPQWNGPASSGSYGGSATASPGVDPPQWNSGR